MEGFAAVFGDLADPRTGNAARHDLLEILLIALCTVLSGGQTAVDMAEFAEAKEGFLREFLTLENGLPSHDTFSRIFRLLDPEQFSVCFGRFMTRFAAEHGIIAIDGKVSRRSFDRASAKSALHMVSAWGCEERLVLAQVSTDAKSNEITAVPRLLAMLSLRGSFVTVDALNCQRTIAKQIIDQGGNYALALKGNQRSLHTDVRDFLDDPATPTQSSGLLIEADHGRVETRIAIISDDVSWLEENHNWPGLKAIGKINRSREIDGKTTSETAYYLLSTAVTPERFAQIARSHWAIENSLHWCLDVIMNEDQARARMDNAPHNLAVLRHLALNAVRKDPGKGSLRVKLKRAAWNNEYLNKLLTLF